LLPNENQSECDEIFPIKKINDEFFPNKQGIFEKIFVFHFYFSHLCKKKLHKKYGQFTMCFRLEFRPFGNLLEPIVHADFRIFLIFYFVHQV
jgi:hypothetical protein